MKEFFEQLAQLYRNGGGERFYRGERQIASKNRFTKFYANYRIITINN